MKKKRLADLIEHTVNGCQDGVPGLNGAEEKRMLRLAKIIREYNASDDCDDELDRLAIAL